MRQALEMALEFIERVNKDGWILADFEPEMYNTITAIKEALAPQSEARGLSQPEQEPVAFYVYKPTLPRGHLGNVSDGDLPWVYDQDPSSGYSARMLVYTTPPQRKPLTDEQIGDISKNYALSNPTTPLYFARAIEAAHGIKE